MSSRAVGTARNHDGSNGGRGAYDPVMAPTAAVVFTVMAVAVLAALPLMVGALIERLGFNEEQAGWIAAADMLGASVSALVASLILARSHWQTMLWIGVYLLTIADVLSGLTHNFAMLFSCRIGGGLGEGLLLAIGNAGIAETRNPDRLFGFSTAAQLAFGAVALFLIPWMLNGYGLRGVFWSLAGLAGLAGALIRYMPSGARAKALPASPKAPGLAGQSVLGLAGTLTYFIAQGAVWAYLERMGSSQHIESAAVGRALAISSIAGLAGASASSWLDIRIGRLRPLLITTLCTVVSLEALNRHISFLVFTAAASLFNFAWNASVPFQFGALAHIDSSRRTVALGGAVVFAGLTIGPALAAETVGVEGLNAINWIGMIFSLLSFLLFAALLWPLERLSGHPRASDSDTAMSTYGKT